MRIGEIVKMITGYDASGQPVLSEMEGTVIAIIMEDNGEYESLKSITVRWTDGKVLQYNRNEEDSCLDLEPVTPLLYVNIYIHDRAYGGPEEGGWFYDTYEPVPEECVLASSVENAEEILEMKRKWCEEQNSDRRSPSSVLSDGHYVAHLEAWPAEYKPSNRPYYC